MSELIYLDYNATTPLDPVALEAMQPFFADRFGNAASRHHRLGCDAAGAVDHAREQIASLLGGDPREICWTSGATEANNLALLGLARCKAYEKRRHIITVRSEHHAVLDPCRWLESHGYDVTWLGVDQAGLIDLAELEASLRDDTLVVSVMAANNETGVLQPIREIAARVHGRGALFHTDATQAVGKIPVDVEADGIDLLSFSAHKFYGPKGVGGLHVRKRGPRVRLEPILHGGGHERGLRSGTLNTPGIVGLGAAAARCTATMNEEAMRQGALRDAMQSRLATAIPGLRVNGGDAPRLPNTLNVSFPDTDADELLQSLPHLCLSTASACTSAAVQPSHVLGAMGRSDEEIAGSVRISLGRATTESQAQAAVGDLIRAVGEGT